MIFRTFVCLALAGLYATVTAAREKDKNLKIRLLRYDGLLVLGSIILAVPAGYWYFKALPPQVAAGLIPGAVPYIAMQVMLVAAAVLAFLTLLGTIFFPRHWGYVSAGVLLFCGLLSLGGFEWMREGLRKPFIISEFLYGNSLLAADAAKLSAAEPMAIAYSTGDRGRDIYLVSCRACHTRSDYHSLADRLAGLDSAYIAQLIPRLQYFRAAMPPFPGSHDDADALAGYLKSIAGPDPAATRPELSETAKGEIVFNHRCGGCHTMAGAIRPIGTVFNGMAQNDVIDAVRGMGDISDRMPAYSGSDEDLRLLAIYLTGAGNAGGK